MAPYPVILFDRNPAIMSLEQNQVAALGHAVEGFMDEADLHNRLRERPVSLLVVGVGVEVRSRMGCPALSAELGIRLLEHHGGAEELSRSVEAALSGHHA